MAVRFGTGGATTIGRECMIGAIREAGGNIVAVLSSEAARGERDAAESRMLSSPPHLPALLSSAPDAVAIATINVAAGRP